VGKDRLTATERFGIYNGYGVPDRLPCVPIVGNTAARVIGVKVSQLRDNGPLLAEAHVAAYRLFGYDTIRIFTDLYTLAEAMGASVHVPDDETAYLAGPAIADVSEIVRLRPVDPLLDGRLPAHLEAMRLTFREVGQEVPVTGAVTGPFTTASFLVGTETLVRLTYKNPALVHRLCEIALGSALVWSDAVIATGCTPSLTDPMSSSTVISPASFREFSFPYLKRLISFIHSEGKKVTLHICGKTNRIWESMVEAGADCLSIDNEVDLLDARRRIGDRVRLMGNVRPSEIMLEGTTRDVQAAVLEGVRKAWDNPKGYIVASGCSLPTETPFDNIHAMLDTVRELGYPIKGGQLKEDVA